MYTLLNYNVHNQNRIINHGKLKKTSFICLIILIILSLCNNIFYGIPVLNAQTILLPTDDSATWTSLGPGGGGAITAIAINPTNENIVYVGTDIGGIFKSIDGGQSFKFINNGLTELGIQEIVISPQNPNVIYIGTTGGIYKSDDSGETWVKKRKGFPQISQSSFSAPVKGLAIDPKDPRIIYAGVSITLGNAFYYKDRAESYNKGQIYKSTDAGESWFKINNPGPNNIDNEATIFEIAVNPQNSNILYATTNKGFYKSVDGGINWSRKVTGIPYLDVRGLAVNPFNPNIIYITVWTPQYPWLGGVYKSIDGGETWLAKNTGLKNRNDGSGKRTSNYAEILIDPINPNNLYTGDWAWGFFGPKKSINGGESWLNLISYNNDGSLKNISVKPFGNVGVSAMAISFSNPNIIYFGSSMNLFKTEDAGNKWISVHTKEVAPDVWQSSGIENTCLLTIAVDPNDANNIYFGYADISLWKSKDGGSTFTKCNGLRYNDDIWSIAFDPADSNILYASDSNSGSDSNSVIIKSIDKGESWTILGDYSNGLPNSGYINSIVIDPNSPKEMRTIYITKSIHGVYKSTNGGRSWYPINNGLPNDIDARALTIDPVNNNILYLGASAKGPNGTRDYGGIYKTVNGGISWELVNNTKIVNVRDIKINPKNPKMIFVATNRHNDTQNSRYFNGGVFKSIDSGKNWKQVLVDRWINCLAINPKNPNIIYATSMDNPFHDEYVNTNENGLFKSVDYGENWKVINNGLPHTNIYDVKISPSNPEILYIGTNGGGGFKMSDSSVVEFKRIMKQGWNLISIPLQLSDNKIDKVFDSIANDYISIWTFDNTWKNYSVNMPDWANSLEFFSPDKGYWVEMARESVLRITGKLTHESPLRLNKGWNLIGYNGVIAVPIKEALSSINGKYESVWAFENNQFTFFSNTKNIITLNELKPGNGYWINTLIDCELITGN